jgi:hypothetical protein
MRSREAPREGGWETGEDNDDDALPSFPLSQMRLGVWTAHNHSGMRFLLGRSR